MRVLTATLMAFAAAALLPRAAEAAYIDPNTGGMLFQAAAATFAAISGLILVFSSRIKMALKRLRRRIRESGEEDISSDAASD